MRHRLTRIGSVFLFLAFSLGGGPASAGPIDFLKRVGRSIVHPHDVPHPARKQRVRRKRATADVPKRTTVDAKSPGAAAPTGSSPAAAVAPVLEAVKLDPAKPTPSPWPVRAALGVPAADFAKVDLPYGVPVAGRSGFVTSPYSPAGGYVDVRGYASGTEVRDPYTGKVFRTP